VWGVGIRHGQTFTDYRHLLLYGLITTTLVGRTLADLITGHGTCETTLPWVNHRSQRWEPEPWRFIGANAGL
jgi:hypothetical protein